MNAKAKKTVSAEDLVRTVVTKHFRQDVEEAKIHEVARKVQAAIPKRRAKDDSSGANMRAAD